MVIDKIDDKKQSERFNCATKSKAILSEMKPTDRTERYSNVYSNSSNMAK